MIQCIKWGLVKVLHKEKVKKTPIEILIEHLQKTDDARIPLNVLYQLINPNSDPLDPKHKNEHTALKDAIEKGDLYVKEWISEKKIKNT